MRKIEIINQENRYLNRSLWSNLQALKSTISFMQTGAHPDDETSKLLAKLSLDDGFHVSYVNAVRGQGGQNSIGVERGDKLGSIRTLELINAMSMLRVDTGWLAKGKTDSITDFGFSKSGDETFSIWDKNHTIKQMILMVRALKPDIIIPTFLDVDGQHGHHRAVTRATINAYEFSGDRSVFPEIEFDPWNIAQIFLPAWGGGGGSYDDEEDPPEATHWIEVGNFNNIFGGTYNQIGEWSRAYHSTQGMGKMLHEDNSSVPLHLLKGTYKKGDISGGVIPKNLLELSEFSINQKGKKVLIDAHKYSEEALLHFNNTNKLTDSLSNLKRLLDIAEELISSQHTHRIKLKQKQCSVAMADCLALLPTLDFKSDIHFIGGEINANLSFHKNDNFSLNDVSAKLNCPFETNIRLTRNSKLSSNRENFVFEGIINHQYSYFDLYQRWHGIAQKPLGLHASLSFKLKGAVFSVDIVPSVNFSILPDVIGSIKNCELLNIIDRDQNSNLIPVNFLINKFSPNRSELILNYPKNWLCNNSKLTIKESSSIESVPCNFEIKIPTLIEEGLEKISLKSNNRSISEIDKIEYTHTGKITFEDNCNLSILSINIKPLSNLKIGWIDGNADKAWKWAEMLGADVRLLSDDEIISDDFSNFDTIVSGVFAGAKRPIHKISAKINNWIKNGGNYVTEYHRPHDNWNENESCPYYLKIGSPSIRWRVTNPDAKVDFLAPDHVLFNNPNPINKSDFNGWVKERGLYFASKWDKNYSALLSMSDSNEKPLHGGLLVCNYGDGRHIHCALNLFYQMDNLVPGAFRIFANILSK